MQKKSILILKTGNTYSQIAQNAGGDFEEWFSTPLLSTSQSLSTSQPLNILTLNVHNGSALPALDEAKTALSGIIITGSSAMVTEQRPWMIETARWLKCLFAIAPIPTLGVCFGHQLLAHTLGGKVGPHPKGREIGTREIQRLPASQDDPLFNGLPTHFPAQLSHLQSVLELPPETTHLATGDFEPHHAFRYQQHVWGIQFHPEFTPSIMQGYIDQLRPAILKEGLNPAALENNITETNDSVKILNNFTKVVLHNRTPNSQ